jgi:hypothetical protein
MSEKLLIKAYAAHEGTLGHGMDNATTTRREWTRRNETNFGERRCTPRAFVGSDKLMKYRGVYLVYYIRYGE